MSQHPSSTPSAEASPIAFSTGLRRTFNLAALGMAFLPIPVVLLHLLPSYWMQGRFLVFYAPFVGLLTFAYLVYVRDSVARIMFGHLLNPLPDPSDYFPERSGLRVRRLLRRMRIAFLALLPGVLLVVSFTCFWRYVSRFGESMAIATAAVANHPRLPEEVGASDPSGGPDAEEEDRSGPLRTERRGATQAPRTGQVALTAPADTRSTRRAGAPADTVALRQLALRVTPIADIPYFTELAALYIGAFLAALVALLLMGMREYAKEALGLSEEDVVLGRFLVKPE
jgi:hypothetical protein